MTASGRASSRCSRRAGGSRVLDRRAPDLYEQEKRLLQALGGGTVAMTGRLAVREAVFTPAVTR